MSALDLCGMSDADVESALALIEESLSNDERAREAARAIEPATVVFAAVDTDRRVAVELAGGRISLRLDGATACDVMIEATEETLSKIFRGESDADAAYFSGRLSIRGSLMTAFRLRTRLLGLVQAHVVGMRPPLAVGRALACRGAGPPH